MEQNRVSRGYHFISKGSVQTLVAVISLPKSQSGMRKSHPATVDREANWGAGLELCWEVRFRTIQTVLQLPPKDSLSPKYKGLEVSLWSAMSRVALTHRASRQAALEYRRTRTLAPFYDEYVRRVIGVEQRKQNKFQKRQLCTGLRNPGIFLPEGKTKEQWDNHSKGKWISVTLSTEAQSQPLQPEAKISSIPSINPTASGAIA